MKKYVVRLLTMVCALVALVTVSFAWMLGTQELHEVPGLKLDYTDGEHTLTVVSQELSFEALAEDGTGEDGAPVYVPFNSRVFDNAVPGKIIPFVIRFYNHASKPITIDLSLAEITSEKDGAPFSEDGKSLIHHTFISLMSDGDIFHGIMPVEEYKCLGDGLEGDAGSGGHSLIIVSGMQIPVPESEGLAYEMHCYFLIDGSVDAAFQDVSLTIGSIVVAIH